MREQSVERSGQVPSGRMESYRVHFSVSRYGRNAGDGQAGVVPARRSIRISAIGRSFRTGIGLVNCSCKQAASARSGTASASGFIRFEKPGSGKTGTFIFCSFIQSRLLPPPLPPGEGRGEGQVMAGQGFHKVGVWGMVGRLHRPTIPQNLLFPRLGAGVRGWG